MDLWSIILGLKIPTQCNERAKQEFAAGGAGAFGGEPAQGNGRRRRTPEMAD